MRSCAKVGIGLTFLTGNAFSQTITTAENGPLIPASLSNSPSALTETETFGFGQSYGTAFGRNFGKGLRAEVESLSSNASSDRLGGLAAGGTFTSTRVTLKGIYELRDGAWHVKPYIGAGLRMIDMNEHIAGLAGDD